MPEVVQRKRLLPRVAVIVMLLCCLAIGLVVGAPDACASTIYAVAASGAPGEVVEVPILFELLGAETGINKIQVLASVTADSGATALTTSLGVNGVYATRCGSLQLQPPPNNTLPLLTATTTSFDWNWSSNTSRFVVVDGPQTGYEACRMLVTLPDDAVNATTYTVHLIAYDVVLKTGTTVKVAGVGPIPASGSTLGADVKITVIVPHAFSVTAAVAPDAVASGGSAELSATPDDSLDHGVATWAWDDGGAGGSFSDASAQNPTYTAPANLTDSDVTVTLTVNATCDDASPLSDSDSVTLTVRPAAGDGEVTDSTLPSALIWEEEVAAAITFHNSGSLTWDPDDGYRLLAEDGVDRWGLLDLPLTSVGAPDGDLALEFTITAPPVTTLSYFTDGTPSAPPAGSLDCAWVLARGNDPVSGTLASELVTISRFADIQPGTDGAWARYYVEECAGRIPLIVGGYGDGSYRPALGVTRDQMAVFVQRAFQLPLHDYAGEFTDVEEGFWADDYIQSCKDAGLVAGYPDGTYRPSLPVDRAGMAVFVARGLAGGDTAVPTGPVEATFADVPLDYWAFKYVEYAVTQAVVGGYGDGTYRPTVAVDRGQMAVFMYRSAIQPTGAVVVLGGPAVTGNDPSGSGVCGWTTLISGAADDPGYSYVAVDALRLGDNLAVGGTWDVTFELREAASPTTPAAGAYTTTVTVSPGEIAAAQAATLASGDPYLVLSWDLPAGLTPGDYLLVVSVEDATGEMCALTRTVAFTVAP